MRLRWLEYEGRPAAIEYSLTGGDTVYYYQSGLDPAMAEESPGWVALGATLRDAIAEGYRMYDFARRRAVQGVPGRRAGAAGTTADRRAQFVGAHAPPGVAGRQPGQGLGQGRIASVAGGRSPEPERSQE